MGSQFQHNFAVQRDRLFTSAPYNEVPHHQPGMQLAQPPPSKFSDAASDPGSYEYYFGTGNMKETGSIPARADEYQQFPAALEGPCEFLTKLTIELITNADAFVVREILPFKRADNIDTVELDELVFHHHLLQRTAYEVPPRLLKYERRHNSWTFGYYGIGMKLEVGFAKTPLGRQAYRMHLTQIANATINTSRLSAYQALFLANYNADPTMNYYQLTMPLHMFHKYMDSLVNMWAMLAKSRDGLGLLVSQAKRILGSRGVQPDTIILPNGSDAIVNGASSGVMVGPSAKGINYEASLKIAGLNVYYFTPVKRAQRENPVDFSIRERTTGRCMLMTASHLTACAPYFRTGHMQVTVYDEDKDDERIITALQAFNASLLPSGVGTFNFGESIVNAFAMGGEHPLDEDNNNPTIREILTAVSHNGWDAWSQAVVQCKNFWDVFEVDQNGPDANDGPRNGRPNGGGGRGGGERFIKFSAWYHAVSNRPEFAGLKGDIDAASQVEQYGSKKPKTVKELVKAFSDRKASVASLLHLTLTGYKSLDDAEVAANFGGAAVEAVAREISRVFELQQVPAAAMGVDEKKEAPPAQAVQLVDGDDAEKRRRLFVAGDLQQDNFYASISNRRKALELWCSYNAKGSQKLEPQGDSDLTSKFFPQDVQANNFIELIARCIQNDVIPPVAFLLLGPHVTHRMGSAIVCKRGEALGNTYLCNPDFRLATDAARKTIFGHFTTRAGAVVKNPENMVQFPDVVPVNYLRGGGASLMYASNRRLYSLYKQNKICTTDGALFSCIVPFDYELPTARLDITGKFANVAEEAENDKPHYPTAAMYSHYWDWKSHPVDARNDQYIQQGNDKHNTICHVDFHIRGYPTGPQSETLNPQFVKSQGPWGDAYPGCGKVRKAQQAFLEPVDYRRINVITIRN